MTPYRRNGEPLSRISARFQTRGVSHRARIMAAVRHLLGHCRFTALRRVTCHFDGKVLTLSGRVHSYYEKQIAQSLILRRLQEFIVLHNELEVAPALGSTSSAPLMTVITQVVRQPLPRLVEA